MPQMADITVKKFDGTTDIVFNQQQPSAGDNQPAIWKCNAVGTVLAGRPTLSLVARNNGNAKSRRLTASFLYPKVRTDAQSQTVVLGGASGDATFLLPQDMTNVEIQEFAAQFTNLMVATLFRSALTTGYAPA
jgi:hypothetical protein